MWITYMLSLNLYHVQQQCRFPTAHYISTDNYTFTFHPYAIHTFNNVLIDVLN